MCNKNEIETLNIIFSQVSDEFNWLNNTSTPIETINGQLRLVPESNQSEFSRSVGTLDPTNNRIRLIMNTVTFRPQLSTQPNFCAKVEIFNGSVLIDFFTLFLADIEPGESIQYNFDRVYKYEGLSGAISMKITTVEGWQNVLFLDYLKTFNFNYCNDNVRNYFILDGFLADSFGSVSSAIQLLEYKIDGVETLTPAFFSENNSPGGDPVVDWFMAKANLDGSDRLSNVIDPNTFNPFISEFGLDYDPANYYDGKPTGVVSGSNYGSGIMNIGFEKPSILNGSLMVNDGAFFVDIDFNQDLFIVFNVLVNNSNVNVFDSPNIYRQYTILWNVQKCTSQFSYIDILNSNELSNQDNNGFLSGITGIETTTEIINCNQLFEFNGNEGTFEFLINFGTNIGQAGIEHEAFNLPDKFEIEWNGQLFSSGYVGSQSRDQELINLGVPLSQINTGTPSTGNGTLLFNKDQASPTTALIRVTAPFSNTAWNVIGICPSGLPEQLPTVQIIGPRLFNKGDQQTFNITSGDADGTIVSWSIIWGSEGSTSGTGSPPSSIQRTFNTLGSQTITIQVVDNDGNTGSNTFSISVIGINTYSTTGRLFADCFDGINFDLVVTSGSVTLTNIFSTILGNPLQAQISIDGVIIVNFITVVLPVGSYLVTSSTVDCANGTGRNEIFIS
jgi:hypothetical protein